MEIEIDQELEGLLIVSDKGRIKQILLNLLSNSYKFTFKGKISLKVVAKKHRNQEFIEFKVKDTGIGIKEEDQPKLFQLFGMISENKDINPNG